MSGRVATHIRSNVIGYIALFCFAMGGTAYAVDGPLPGQNQVGSDDIINGEVKNGDIGAFEVKANNVAPDSLGGAKIVDRSVKNADLGLGASSSNTIADGGIEAIDVKNNTLTGAQIDESTLAGLWKLGGNSGTGIGAFLGTTDNNPLNLRVNGARGLRLEPASDGTNQSPNVIGGIADNAATPGVHSATIGGGGRSAPGNPASANQVTDNYGTIAGGAHNQAGDGAGTVDDRQFATVGGGRENTASRFQATVGGGAVNTANGNSATVGGGAVNTANGGLATVAGGFVNTASGDFATVPGGDSNTAAGIRSFAAGNRANASHNGAFVWADSNGFNFASTAQDQFSVRSTGGVRLVSGIDGGTGDPTSGLELPAGTSGWSTLVNGQPFDVRVNGTRGLRIDPASDGTNQSPNVIGGIADNSVAPGVHSATIAGGGRLFPADPASANKVSDSYGTVGGGANNQAGDNAGTVGDAELATIGGGGNNTASGAVATVAGGSSNEASGNWDTVGGGFSNTASGFESTVGGGDQNTAGGQAATVPGGAGNSAAGNWSFAAGSSANANHQGAFVWADSRGFDFASTAADQFSARATGGARFVSGIDPFSGVPTAGVELAPGGGSWSSLSDRASKRALKPTSGRKVLRELSSVPISTWSYRTQDRSIRHIGPMAQDFYRAFGVGEDRRHIASIDADGVALAAIKGLSRELRAERRRRHQQERRMDRLQARVAALERDGGR